MEPKEILRKHTFITECKKQTGLVVIIYICLIVMASLLPDTQYKFYTQEQSGLICFIMSVIGIVGFVLLYRWYALMRNKLLNDTKITEKETYFYDEYISSQKYLDENKEKFEKIKSKL